MNSVRTDSRLVKAVERLADAVDQLVSRFDVQADMLIDERPEKVTGTVEDGEKQCSTCGHEFSSRFIFCPYCGKPLIELDDN